jgi:hypothetical protein
MSSGWNANNAVNYYRLILHGIVQYPLERPKPKLVYDLGVGFDSQFRVDNHIYNIILIIR